MSEKDPPIQVEGLSKTYHVPEREAGIGAALKSLIHRKYKEVKAVEQIDFSVGSGEVVGFLGPNGAGKTTTLKMLSGLLHPSAGQARILGFEPFRRNKAFLQQITLVMGQRNQLVWDIPVIDSFERNQAIYRIPMAEYNEVVSEMTELLDLKDLLKKPARNLSLGERMKCETAAALLHRPRILFLDEPTLGLDVTMQRRIRKFLKTYNERHKATILLTSHYMADVEALCRRVIVIHQGKLLFDGNLADLVQKFAAHKTIVVDLENSAGDIEFNIYGEVVSYEAGRVTLRVAKEQTAGVTQRLLSDLDVMDLTVEDPPIEEVIEQVFEH